MLCAWTSANHVLFQLANLFLAFTYFVPSSIKGLVILRLLLGTAGLFFALWGILILCSPDTFGWNLGFMVLNFGHVVYLLYTMRPIKFALQENELIYSNMFEHLGVQRWEYNRMAAFVIKTEFGDGQTIAKENESICQNLTVVASGSVRVLKNGHFIHQVQAFQFVNSPEWIASVDSGSCSPIPYEVTIVSEGCVLLSWPRAQLLRVLVRGSILKNILNSMIGMDIAKKLFKANRRFTQDDGHVGYTNHTFLVDDACFNVNKENGDTISHRSIYSFVSIAKNLADEQTETDVMSIKKSVM